MVWGDNYHPLSASLLKSKGYAAGTAFVKSKSAEWEIASGRRVHPNRDLSKKEPPEPHCRHRWDMCEKSAAPGVLDELERLHKMLEPFVLSLAPQAPQGQVVFRARLVDGSAFEPLQCIGFSKAHGGHPFCAEFVQMVSLDEMSQKI